LFDEASRIEKYETSKELFRCKMIKSSSMNTHVFKMIDDCASKVSLSLLFYICIYCFYLGFFIIIDVLYSNEVSFNVSIGFWSLNELFQKIQRWNSEQRIEEKFC